MGGRGSASNLGKLDKIKINESFKQSLNSESSVISYRGIPNVVNTATDEERRRKKTTKTAKQRSASLFGGTGSGENAEQEERKRKRNE